MSADVHQVSLLLGLIAADEVKAVSTTSETRAAIQSSAAGSNFVSLVVAGSSISGTPAPNTSIGPTADHSDCSEESVSCS